VVVQQGGILDGVAQTLAAGAPVTAAGREWNRVHDAAAATRIQAATARRNSAAEQAAELDARFAALEAEAGTLARPADDTIWAVVVGVVTSILLSIGRYRVIERVSIVLVGTFTLVTLFALAMLQFNPAWAISSRELMGGIVPSIPPGDDARRIWTRRIATAWPLVALVLALVIREPVGMVLASGAMQAVMLAALGVAVLWFRYRAMEPRLTPSKPWDLLLWVSATGFIMVGLWTVWQKLQGIMAAP
jgi:Mn2+/Fe2+ NRAMP family transporter